MNKYYAIKDTKTIIEPDNRSWAEVQAQINGIIKGISNVQWKGFKTRAEAEAYINGDVEESKELVQTIGKKSESILDFNAYDAVIFSDGSCNFNNNDFVNVSERVLKYDKDFYTTPYGFVILFPDGKAYCESASIIDNGEENGTEKSFTIVPHGFQISPDGKVQQGLYKTEGVFENGKIVRTYKDLSGKQYALASWNITSETEAARRALDICLNTMKLKKVKLVYDCANANDALKRVFTGKKKLSPANVLNEFEAFLNETTAPFNKKYLENEVISGSEKISEDFVAENLGTGEKIVISTLHQKSHITGGALVEVYNSLADALAKCETFDKPINGTENAPIKNYLPAGGIETVDLDSDEKENYSEATKQIIKDGLTTRRRQVYIMAKEVILKTRWI